jgi:hypothetical protein
VKIKVQPILGGPYTKENPKNNGANHGRQNFPYQNEKLDQD